MERDGVNRLPSDHSEVLDLKVAPVRLALPACFFIQVEDLPLFDEDFSHLKGFHEELFTGGFHLRCFEVEMPSSIFDDKEPGGDEPYLVDEDFPSDKGQ